MIDKNSIIRGCLQQITSTRIGPMLSIQIWRRVTTQRIRLNTMKVSLLRTEPTLWNATKMHTNLVKLTGWMPETRWWMIWTSITETPNNIMIIESMRSTKWKQMLTLFPNSLCRKKLPFSKNFRQLRKTNLQWSIRFKLFLLRTMKSF